MEAENTDNYFIKQEKVKPMVYRKMIWFLKWFCENIWNVYMGVLDK